MISEAERLELVRLIPIVRRKAAMVGPLHADWDVIFDAEALLDGRPAIIEDVSIIIALLKGSERKNNEQRM